MNNPWTGEPRTLHVAATADGRAYAHCPTCGWFDTYRNETLAREKLDTHFNYQHAGFGCRQGHTP